MTGKLAGRVAIVFGAGSVGEGWGNGKAAAVAYARAGARVVAVDREDAAAMAPAGIIEAEGGEALPVAADVTRLAEVEAAVGAAIARFGRIDILHNNVGITSKGGPVETTEETWDRVMAVNVKSMFLMTKAVLPQMLERRDGAARRPCLSFVGTLDFEPNVDAVRFLVGEIWPLVRKAHPDAELLIAGRDPTSAIRASAGRAGIAVQADVPDMSGVLRRSQISIAPMRSGVGVKNKVLEAWASGVPVVLTPLTVNGLSVPRGHERLVCSTARGLAQAVADLFRDGAEARRLGLSARRHVRDRYTWAGSAGEIDRLLRGAAPDRLNPTVSTS